MNCLQEEFRPQHSPKDGFWIILKIHGDPCMNDSVAWLILSPLSFLGLSFLHCSRFFLSSSKQPPPLLCSKNKNGQEKTVSCFSCINSGPCMRSPKMVARKQKAYNLQKKEIQG